MLGITLELTNCQKYILEIYESKRVKEILSKIYPQDLRDDLHQELAVALLSMDCKKIVNLNFRNELLSYSIKTLWLMATSSTSPFYYKYKKNDIDKAVKYLEYLQAKALGSRESTLAQRILADKLQRSANDAHEAIIFQKYIELNSCVEVAKYFKIPKSHIYKVVNNCKAELKKAINDS